MSTSRPYRVSRHAVERFQQRVVNVTPGRARIALEAIAASARRTSRPRHWMRTEGAGRPGTLYLYNHRIPDVCLIVRGDAIATVYTRKVCRYWRSLGSASANQTQTEREAP